MKSTRRIGLTLAMLAMLPLMGGCFGSFDLTKKVYKFNQDVTSDKWGREGMFLLLEFPFFPIYGFAAFFDALFFNSVEFWTGEKLIAEGPRQQGREFRNDYEEAAPAPALPQRGAPAKAPAPAKSKRAPRK